MPKNQIYCPADSTVFKFALLIGTDNMNGRDLAAFIEECPRCAARARAILTEQGRSPDNPGLCEIDKKLWVAIFAGEKTPMPLVATP